MRTRRDRPVGARDIRRDRSEPSNHSCSGVTSSKGSSHCGSATRDRTPPETAGAPGPVTAPTVRAQSRPQLSAAAQDNLWQKRHEDEQASCGSETGEAPFRILLPRTLWLPFSSGTSIISPSLDTLNPPCGPPRRNRPPREYPCSGFNIAELNPLPARAIPGRLRPSGRLPAPSQSCSSVKSGRRNPTRKVLLEAFHTHPFTLLLQRLDLLTGPPARLWRRGRERGPELSLFDLDA